MYLLVKLYRIVSHCGEYSFRMISDVIALVGFTAFWHYLHIASSSLSQYSPQVTTVTFSTTVPQKSTLPEHATTIPEGEEETQMSMCDCD